MPSSDQILASLKAIVNSWQIAAVLWHLYFAIIIAGLIAGTRLLKRDFGILLALPLLFVSIIAWLSANPFNGIVFALLGVLLIYISIKMPREPVEIAPISALLPGILMVIFGWIYPHFLNTSSWWTYLYAAPSGLIPCPTLSIVIGFTLIVNKPGSLAYSITLGVAGLLYGLLGVFKLGVTIDWILLLGALLILFTSRIKGNK
jgi:hypothetical protein